MAVKAKLHFALMCNQSNGGFHSGLTLAQALADKLELVLWSLWGDFYNGHLQLLESTGAPVMQANPVVSVKEGEHLFFYMNDYPALFSNFVEQWQSEFNKAASVQIAFNRNLGSIPAQAWMAGNLSQVYFQNSKMQWNWHLLVKNNALGEVASAVMAPPVNLDNFLDLQRSNTGKLVFGRLAGDGAVDRNSLALYERLAARLPDAEFWFMPGPAELATALALHPQFRFLHANEISVAKFLQATDIFLLTYADSYPVPGPRSLVEAMAVGCAPIVVNREGPKERVVHGESGYCADNDDEFFRFAMQLADDVELRSRISEAARLRAGMFKVSDWVDRIEQNMRPATRDNA